MNLTKLEISNFRSIKKIEFDVESVSNTNTFSLIGINESGKSSFLKGIALFDEEKISYPQDYFDDSEPVKVSFYYKIDTIDLKELKDYLQLDHNFPKQVLSKIELSEVCINLLFDPIEDNEVYIENIFNFKTSIFPDYKIFDNKVVKKEEEEGEEDDTLNLNEFFNNEIAFHFLENAHNVIFWKSSPEYLILDEIDLLSFAANPKKISIPLKNCFDLAGIKDISKAVARLNKPVAIQNLEELLSDKVTTHINQIWPEHPIRIKFKINNNKITFLVEDKGVKFKNKTTSQRSDGFRQLISFLLTLSAENISEELTNTILLLDEPETHLHPSAQINLRDELIKLSNNKNNNIVFFATHSNYMIDKVHIERCYKVSKEKNLYTKLSKIENHITSYAEVNFEVFDISTNDYHNELYGYLEYIGNKKLSGLAKNKKWINDKLNKTEDVSLPTYIRHSIHHPENTLNKKFTDKELKESIEVLRKLKYEK